MGDDTDAVYILNSIVVFLKMAERTRMFGWGEINTLGPTWTWFIGFVTQSPNFMIFFWFEFNLKLFL